MIVELISLPGRINCRWAICSLAEGIMSLPTEKWRAVRRYTGLRYGKSICGHFFSYGDMPERFWANSTSCCIDASCADVLSVTVHACWITDGCYVAVFFFGCPVQLRFWPLFTYLSCWRLLMTKGGVTSCSFLFVSFLQSYVCILCSRGGLYVWFSEDDFPFLMHARCLFECMYLHIASNGNVCMWGMFESSHMRVSVCTCAFLNTGGACCF